MIINQETLRKRDSWLRDMDNLLETDRHHMVKRQIKALYLELTQGQFLSTDFIRNATSRQFIIIHSIIKLIEPYQKNSEDKFLK